MTTNRNLIDMQVDTNSFLPEPPSFLFELGEKGGMQKGGYARTKKNDIGTLGQKWPKITFFWGLNFPKKSIFLKFFRRLGPGPGPGPWSEDFGAGPWARPMGLGPWALAHGPWPMGPGPWALAHGPWPMGLGPWAQNGPNFSKLFYFLNIFSNFIYFYFFPGFGAWGWAWGLGWPNFFPGPDVG